MDDISKCKKCGALEVRKQDGFFPDGRNKKYVDGSGKQWVGRTCPKCVRHKSKDHIKKKRAEAKNAIS